MTGGCIELEYVGSADPSLAVHYLHGIRYRQLRRDGTRRTSGLDRLLAAAAPVPVAADRSLHVRTALRRRVAQASRRRVKAACAVAHVSNGGGGSPSGALRHGHEAPRFGATSGVRGENAAPHDTQRRFRKPVPAYPVMSSCRAPAVAADSGLILFAAGIRRSEHLTIVAHVFRLGIPLDSLRQSTTANRCLHIAKR